MTVGAGPALVVADGQDLRGLHPADRLGRRQEPRACPARPERSPGPGCPRRCGRGPWPRRNRIPARPLLACSKQRTASTRSSIRDEATKPTLRAPGPEEARRVDEEPSAAGILEIGVEHGLAGRGHGLDDPVPAVHLEDEISVDRRGLVLVEDLLGLFGPGGQSREKVDVREARRPVRY